MDKDRRVEYDRLNDERCLEAEASISLLFSAEGRLPVTHSPNGEPRVRAIFNDRDEWTDYAGVANIEGLNGAVYVAEQHVRVYDGELIYAWQFETSARRLDLVLTNRGERIYSSYAVSEATDSAEDVEMRWFTFLGCIQVMRGSLAHDYEEKARYLPAGHHPFRHPALQDVESDLRQS